MDVRPVLPIAEDAWAAQDVGRSACDRDLPAKFRAQAHDCRSASGEEAVAGAEHREPSRFVPLVAAHRGALLVVASQAAADVLADVANLQGVQQAVARELPKDEGVVAAQGVAYPERQVPSGRWGAVRQV
jgi:hypothetical protein